MPTIAFLTTNCRDRVTITRSVGQIVQAAKTRGNHDGTYRSMLLTHTIDDRGSKPPSSTRTQSSGSPSKRTYVHAVIIHSVSVTEGWRTSLLFALDVSCE